MPDDCERPAHCADRKTLHIVAVHGVGFPEPGSVLPDLMQAFARCRPGSRNFAPREMTVDGFVYRGAQNLDDADRTVAIWDANWADIHRAPKAWPLGLLFLARLLVGTVAYAGGKSKVGRLFHRFFSGVLLWLPVIPALSLWSAVLVPWWLFLLVAAAIAGGVLFVAWKLELTDPLAFTAGKVWACLVVLLTLLHFILPDGLSPDTAGKAGLWVQFTVAVAGPALILGFVLTSWLGVPARVHFSRAGLLALCFALVTGLMAALLWVNLYAADKLATSRPDLVSAAALDAWDSAYVRALPYHVAAAEAVTAWATALVGGLFVAALGLWCFFTFIRPWNRSGALFRRAALGVVFLVVPVFFATFVFILLDMAEVILGSTLPAFFVGLRDWLVAALPWIDDGDVARLTGSSEANLIAIYGESALRLLPFVAMLAATPVRVGLDVTADILHYLHNPEAHQKRLSAFLEALEQPENARIAVVAHSQGSRIAVDTVFTGALKEIEGRLATTGSPVDTLYGVFLDESKLPERGGNWTWQNFWRGSDFIGGPIPEQPGVGPSDWPITKNFHLFHLHYWIEDEVMQFLLD